MSLLTAILAPGALTIVGQPIYSIADFGASVHAVECLCRGPKGTPLERPELLFDYVRRASAEPELDRYLIGLALAECRALPASCAISINVHASTLGRDQAFAKFLARTARDMGIEMSRVTIEIVEHVPAGNYPCFLANLANLRAMDAHVALDDVGMGYSNYHMMLHARPEYLKLDRFLVDGIETDFARVAIVNSVLSLSRAFGSSVVAEGVETASQLATLIKIGVTMFQGFMLCKPRPIPDLLGELTRHPEQAFVHLVQSTPFQPPSYSVV